jgi:hypothetical protein
MFLVSSLLLLRLCIMYLAVIRRFRNSYSKAGCSLCSHRVGLGRFPWVPTHMPCHIVLLSVLPYPLGASLQGAVTLWTHKPARIMFCTLHLQFLPFNSSRDQTCLRLYQVYQIYSAMDCRFLEEPFLGLSEICAWLSYDSQHRAVF